MAFWAQSAADVLPQLSSRDQAIPFLLNEIQARFDKLDSDWLTVASQSPIHGFIGVLSKVLQMESQVHPESYQPIIELCQVISNYMLITLSRKSSCDPGHSSSQYTLQFDNRCKNPGRVEKLKRKKKDPDSGFQTS